MNRQHNAHVFAFRFAQGLAIFTPEVMKNRARPVQDYARAYAAIAS